MAVINLFNGSRKQVSEPLGWALAELAKYQHVEVSPKLNQPNITGYRLVSELEKASMARGRNQVNIDTLASKLVRKPEIYRRSNTQKIILLERDLFGRGTNWCYGQYRKENGMDMVILSTSRVKNKFQLFDLLAHEIGHMYGAAPRGRSKTTQSLVSHCINDLCVMQQKLTEEEALQYVASRHRVKAPTYCGQCQDDLRA